MIEFLSAGLLQLPWWGHILVALGLTHITIAAVTIYLHRCATHRGVDLHPLVSHLFRFWLWLTTGMRTLEWVAIHRKHHALCEREGDPHSPHFKGINKVLWEGAELYQEEAKNQVTLEKYGHGCVNDFIERHLYTPRIAYGIVLMLFIDFTLMGIPGIAVWAVQMMWIPFFAAGVINGLGHWWGYRNFECPDGSTNISPWGLLIGGEELHNNHHAYPSSAKFALRSWEFDLGWFYLRALSLFGLAKIKRVAPQPVIDPGKRVIDLETVKAVVVSRMHVLENYAKGVIMPVHKAEVAKAEGSARALLQKAKQALVSEETRMNGPLKAKLSAALENNNVLETVYEFRRRLQEIWDGAALSHDKLLKALQDWCAQAEASGIKALEEFAVRLRGYSLQPLRA